MISPKKGHSAGGRLLKRRQLLVKSRECARGGRADAMQEQEETKALAWLARSPSVKK